MKTAISLPDDIYDRATSRAQQLGISRSQFFADAARHYLETLDRSSLTEQINAALELTGPEDGQDAAFRQEAARRAFDRVEW
jgi:metal-responsive CopG/Arc/MetJ family transcriptional regulator